MLDVVIPLRDGCLGGEGEIIIMVVLELLKSEIVFFIGLALTGCTIDLWYLFSSFCMISAEVTGL